jgi:uncharacterized membrane protein
LGVESGPRHDKLLRRIATLGLLREYNAAAAVFDFTLRGQMSTAISIPRRENRMILAAILFVLAAAMLWFLSHKKHYFFDYSVASYTDYYWPRRLALIAHLTGGVLAITTGLVQIWLGLTHRTSTLHRSLGKIYASGVLVGSLGGLYLVATIPGHLPYRFGLFMLAAAWIITTGMALYAIHNRRFEQHRAWMVRSYIVTFAFVTFRLMSAWLRGWIHVPDDAVADDIDTLMAWACWAVPLLLAEPLIQLRSIRAVSRTAQPAASS